jgi:hypothetical protein
VLKEGPDNVISGDLGAKASHVHKRGHTWLLGYLTTTLKAKTEGKAIPMTRNRNILNAATIFPRKLDHWMEGESREDYLSRSGNSSTFTVLNSRAVLTEVLSYTIQYVTFF